MCRGVSKDVLINGHLVRENKIKYSKTSLIQTNLEQILVQISESLNYRSDGASMFREVMKWIMCVFLGNTTLF
jgi:hypothetical protein